MQYREQGSKIQVLAYRGYNKEKKRAEVKMLGSFDKYTFDMSDGLIDALTVSEREELQSKLEVMKKDMERTNRSIHFRAVVHSLVNASPLIDAGESFTESVARLDASSAEKAWSALIALEKELESAGYPRPKRTYRKKSDQRELSL